MASLAPPRDGAIARPYGERTRCYTSSTERDKHRSSRWAFIFAVVVVVIVLTAIFGMVSSLLGRIYVYPMHKLMKERMYFE